MADDKLVRKEDLSIELFSPEEFCIMELEDRMEFMAFGVVEMSLFADTNNGCNVNCGCPPPNTNCPCPILDGV